MTSPIDLMEITRRATEADAMEADATDHGSGWITVKRRL